jgi:hypothetical protein
MQLRPIAAAVAAALAIGACGDSEGGSGKTTSVSVKPSATAPETTTTATTPKAKSKAKTAAKPTKAQAVATGDKTCTSAKEKRKRLERVGTNADQAAALAAQTGSATLLKYANALSNELGLLRRLDYARKHKQSKQVDFLLSALAKQRHRARVLAKEYGFQVCGSG